MRRLFELKQGECASVRLNGLEGGLRARLESVGLCEGLRVCRLFTSPFGDPTAFDIGGTVIALRRQDCQNIWVD